MLKPCRRNLFSAPDAIAPFTFIEPVKRRADPNAFLRATTFLRLRHRLLLYRIHSRKAAHTILLQRDRLPPFRANPVFFDQFGPARQQGGTGCVFGHVNDQSIAPDP